MGSQVHVRHEDVEGDSRGLGRDHRAEGELRAQHDVGSPISDSGVDVAVVGAQWTGELHLQQPGEQLPGALALPVAVGVVLGEPVRSIGCLGPSPERRSGGLDLVGHRVLGQHGDFVPTFEEAADDSELDGDGAAPVDECHKVLQVGHVVISVGWRTRMPSTS